MIPRIALAIALSALAVAKTADAQVFDPTSLLESPFKMNAQHSGAWENVVCTLPLGAGASLFGVDDVAGVRPITEFFANELNGTYRVFHFNENCVLLGSWSTAFGGPTMTGITYDSANATYWVVDPFNTAAVHEYHPFTGLPTGASHILPSMFPAVWGPIGIDKNQPGKLAYVEDIAADVAIEIDLTSGAIGCSFPNQPSGYGNGIGDALDPSICSGTTIVLSSGAITAGQPTHVIQTDCSLTYCTTWEIATPLAQFGEWFPNGIEEFAREGTDFAGLCVAGNATGTIFILDRAGLGTCQNPDSDASVLFVSADRGGPDFVVEIGQWLPTSVAIQKPGGAGNGRFFVHLNSGYPGVSTMTLLPESLGVSCFPILFPPFGSASPISVWNNLGKTNRIGASRYFGSAIPDPAPAPVVILALPAGDPVNIPYGSQWTCQGIILNPNAGSPRGASLTNGVGILVDR